jgi:hypothetical protein
MRRRGLRKTGFNFFWEGAGLQRLAGLIASALWHFAYQISSVAPGATVVI